MRAFTDLTEREILALAISSEEEDGRILADYADSLRDEYPDSAQVFADMAAEEHEHRRRLIDTFVDRFGSHIPLVRRQDVRGAPARKPAWQVRPLGIEAVRRQVHQLEVEASRFYTEAASRTTDAAVRKLLGDLAAAEMEHQTAATTIEQRHLPDAAREKENDSARRRFVLQIVQPGLIGLMDGSVSTLAPVFAAAIATQSSRETLIVGMAASVGAGISMGFAEALSDDGKLSGRGAPLLRGVVFGLMTVAGGIGHTLPYLLPNVWTATALAAAVTVAELAAITWIQWKYMETPPVSAFAKVMLGGGLVLGAGILIGSA